MKANDRKTVGRVTVVIHKITRATVYYAKSCACGCGKWALRQMDKAEFKRQWEAAA